MSFLFFFSYKSIIAFLRDWRF